MVFHAVEAIVMFLKLLFISASTQCDSSIKNERTVRLLLLLFWSIVVKVVPNQLLLIYFILYIDILISILVCLYFCNRVYLLTYVFPDEIVFSFCVHVYV